MCRRLRCVCICGNNEEEEEEEDNNKVSDRSDLPSGFLRRKGFVDPDIAEDMGVDDHGREEEKRQCSRKKVRK